MQLLLQRRRQTKRQVRWVGYLLLVALSQDKAFCISNLSFLKITSHGHTLTHPIQGL